jgi:hypothetical protein
MADSLHLLEFKGCVDHKTIDQLLKNLKKNKDFILLNKTIGKRTYSIIVECLENVAKHAEKCTAGDKADLPHISVVKEGEKIYVRTGNLVRRDRIRILDSSISLVNRLNESDLLSLYDSKINMPHETAPDCAGVGFLLLKLKSRQNIDHSFNIKNSELAYFELKITVNNYIMRKLIKNQTSNSPKVILDPDIGRYEISGESRPPDVAGFYGDILNWFDDYSHYLMKSRDVNNPVVINLDFDYFNSSSAKYILDFCKKIADVRSKGKEIGINWHYEDDDADMLETGREMSKMAKFPFEYIVKQR